MLKFVFDYSKQLENQKSLSGFDLGYLEIVGDRATVSSKTPSPGQAIMLFASVCDLLFGVRKLLETRTKTCFEFVGID